MAVPPTVVQNLSQPISYGCLGTVVDRADSANGSRFAYRPCPALGSEQTLATFRDRTARILGLR